MLTKRIIPCLDILNGKVVKGVNFQNIREMGDPVILAEYYNNSGADELIFLDIAASKEKRKTIPKLALKISMKIFIPFTVGGGISNVEDMESILNNGADKISVNTSAVINPKLISQGKERFGSQAVVLAIDAKMESYKNYKVAIYGGTKLTDMDVIAWAKKGESLGAGEILLTSMNKDGTKSGFDIDLVRAVTEAVNIPVIASGGGGSPENFYEVFTKTECDAALAASILHNKNYTCNDLKKYLSNKNIPVRRNQMKNNFINSLKFDEKGLIPAVIQDYYNKDILMVAYMNKESLEITLNEKRTCFFSRSRQKLWRKGETSGHVQYVKEIHADCDKDTLLIKVKQLGAACHTGRRSCFFNKYD